jgi:hypothetical protein
MSDVLTRLTPGRLLRFVCAAVLAGLLAIPALGLAASKRALLIGINEYASPQVPDLRGAVNDVRLMARVLETRFDFPPGNIRLLTNSDATRQAILAALHELAEAADSNDTVYVHFSGHGSQVEDLRGDEEDGLDETILPHDARMPGIPDIIDDELDAIFSRLRARNMLVVFDSCHSGTVTRAATLRSIAGGSTQTEMLSPVRVRAVSRDTRVGLYAALQAPLGGVRSRGVVRVEGLNHVLMTSAPADQEAFDGPVADGFYGLFSYALARSMDALGPAASALELHDRARAELRDIQAQLNVIAPAPQLEGPADRLGEPPLASPGATPSTDSQDGSLPGRHWVDASPLPEGRMLLKEGALLGALPGSQWALYEAHETRFRFGHALAAGTVQALLGNDAVMSVQQQRAALPANMRAVRLTSPDTWASLPVRFIGVNSARAADLVARLQQSVGEVTLAGEREFARFLLELRDGNWRIWDAGGLSELLAFDDGHDAVVAPIMARTIAGAGSALALLALDNPTSDIDLRVAIIDAALANDSGAPVRGVVVRPSGNEPTYRFRREGEPRSAANSLMLEIFSDRPGYVSVVHVDPSGRSALLFPNGYQNRDFIPDGHIPARTRVRIPDAFGDGNRAGFHWDYGPPEGRDTLRIFLAENLDTARTIRNAVAIESAPMLTPVRALQAELTKQLVRGVVLRPAAGSPSDTDLVIPAAGNWTARTVVLEVRP